MALSERRYLYPVATVDGKRELDFIRSSIDAMNLKTSQQWKIPSQFEHRPDLISYKFFGTYHLGWLLARHNGFMDMTFDFNTGVTLKIPDITDFYKYYYSNSRGDDE